MLGDKHLVGAEKKVKAEPSGPSPGEEAGGKKRTKKSAHDYKSYYRDV